MILCKWVTILQTDKNKGRKISDTLISMVKHPKTLNHSTFFLNPRSAKNSIKAYLYYVTDLKNLLRYLVAVQLNSSSPFGQSTLPSHRLACEMHTAGTAEPHLNVCSGHVFLSLQSSSDPSLQSFRPSHTKNQLIQIPELLHCKKMCKSYSQRVYTNKPASSAVIFETTP